MSLQFFFFFFSFIFISWRLITLQYCSGFCHTLTWISHGFTCVPHPDPPSLQFLKHIFFNPCRVITLEDQGCDHEARMLGSPEETLYLAWRSEDAPGVTFLLRPEGWVGFIQTWTALAKHWRQWEQHIKRPRGSRRQRPVSRGIELGMQLPKCWSQPGTNRGSFSLKVFREPWKDWE